MATLINSPFHATPTFANIFRREAVVSCQFSVFSKGKPFGALCAELHLFELRIPGTAFTGSFTLDFLTGQGCRIFVHALAESAFHPPGEADSLFPKLIA